MKKLDAIILSVGAIAVISGLILMFIPRAPSEWGIGCFVLAGIAFLGEWIFYILSAVDLWGEKAEEDTEIEKKP